jgi:hypothetical protein
MPQPLPPRAPRGIDFSNYIAERIRRFTGRAWLFADLHDWLAAWEGKRTFAVTGEPGSGKTAFSGMLSEISDGATSHPPAIGDWKAGFLSAAHFCFARDRRWINPHAFAESIALQLARRYPVFADSLVSGGVARRVHLEGQANAETVDGGMVAGIYIHQLSLGASSAEDAFEHAVRQPLEALFATGFDEPVTILVDGLDESLQYAGPIGIVTLLAEAATLHSKVRFIITTRPLPRVLKALERSGLREAPLSKDESIGKTRADVQAFVLQSVAPGLPLAGKLPAHLAAERFAEAVGDKADGNFLYVQQLLLMLENSDHLIDENALRALPSGLDGIYTEFLDRVAGGAGDRWLPEFSPILGTLSVAQQPLGETQISSFTGITLITARRMLSDLRQLLETDDSVPYSTRAYSLYHRSFADYLVNSDRAGDYWCDPRAAHQAIATAYRKDATGWRDVVWSKVDIYGLRYLILHLIEATPGEVSAAAEAFGAGLITEKVARFGSERSVLEDVRLLISASQEAEDLPILLRAAWAYVGLRHRIAGSLIAETLPLRIRLGQAPLVLEMLGSLDEKSREFINEGEHVRRHMAAALAREGYVDDALAVVEQMPAKERPAAVSVVADNVAHCDSLRALALLRREPGARPGPDLCRFLAANDSTLGDALSIAGECGPLLETIAVTVAARDLPRALEIVAMISPYEEIAAGERRQRGAAKARTEIAIALARAGANAETLLNLCRSIGTEEEQKRAIFHVARHLAGENDPRAFLAVDLIDANSTPEARRLANYFPRSLALAAVVANTTDAAIRTEARERWLKSPCAIEFKSIANYLDLLGRCDIVGLRTAPEAAEMASVAIFALEQQIRDWQPTFRFAEDAAGVMAAALAVFDLKRALSFVQWGDKNLKERHAAFRENALSSVIIPLAHLDPEEAVRLAEEIGGWYTHLAYLEIIKIVGATDFSRALALVDQVDKKFGTSKRIFYGVLGAQLKERKQTEMREVLARFPSYVDSNAFLDVFSRVLRVVVREIARYDSDKATALIERYRSRLKDWEQELLSELARGVAARDQQRAMSVASNLTEGFDRARALLEIAQHVPSVEASSDLLLKALSSVQQEPPGLVERDEVTAEILKLLAVRSPFTALIHVKEIGMAVFREASLTIITAEYIKAPGASWQSIARAFLDALHRPEVTPAECATAFGMLYDSLPVSERADLVSWAQDEAPAVVARALSFWHAPGETDAEIARSEDLEGRGTILQGHDSWKLFLLRHLARKNPAGALTAYRALKPQDDGQWTLGIILAQMGRRDARQALELIMKEPWEFDIYRADALRELVRVLAPLDWRQALDVARQMEYLPRRADALQHVIDAVGGAEVEVEALKLVAAEAPLLRDEREGIYRGLLLAGAKLHEPDIAFTTTCISALALGDRDSFLHLLPCMISLIAAHGREVTLGLEQELAEVTKLLAA